MYPSQPPQMNHERKAFGQGFFAFLGGSAACCLLPFFILLVLFIIGGLWVMFRP